jgi:hypothetical protein
MRDPLQTIGITSMSYDTPARERMIKRWTNYATKVECRRCGTQVYPDREDTEAFVESIVDEHGGIQESVSHICAGCDHMDKDDYL